jgi:hypothetical protein
VSISWIPSIAGTGNESFVRLLRARSCAHKCNLLLLAEQYTIALTLFIMLLCGHCSQPATFISAVLLVTCTMLRLGLPHVNVLTKVGNAVIAVFVTLWL